MKKGKTSVQLDIRPMVKVYIRPILCSALVVGTLVAGVPLASAATATATLTAGTLTITAPPANFSYPSTQLTGSPFNLTSSFAVGVNDATGSKAGWNLQATIGVLTDTSSDTLPASGHTIQSVTITPGTGTAPTDGITTYGTPIPTTAAKIFSATAGTGMGQSTETFNTQLAVPADASAGTYTATLTVSIVSGP